MAGFPRIVFGEPSFQVRRYADITFAFRTLALKQVHVPHEPALLRQGFGGHPLRHPASHELLGLSCEARRAKQDGGEDGIRTHEKLLTSTPLAGERLRPLGHLSVAPLDREKRRHNQQAGAIIVEKSAFGRSVLVRHAAILRQLVDRRVGGVAAISAGDRRIRPYCEAQAKASGPLDG